MRGRNGFIFNLGHGVPPEARIDSIQAVAETVQTWSETQNAQNSAKDCLS
jgi:uroporphyrinogen-III decarboxylase